MNPNLQKLQPYPFQKLTQLFASVKPPREKADIRLSIGEPKHTTPPIIAEALESQLSTLSRYPLTIGGNELRQAIARWLSRRFKIPLNHINPDTNIIPVNGTREALFAFAQFVVDASVSNAKVLMPNPFYQIYEGAAILAGAEPVYLNCTAANGYVPDFFSVPNSVWNDCQLLYICTPGNPAGAVIDHATLRNLIDLAEKHDFIIASDECYSEIYLDESRPPPGLLGVASQIGNSDFKRCVVFHSLSKRSNAPGLRSGFVAGDKNLLEKFLLYRTYHGCAMPTPIQAASIAAWSDEKHVAYNRQLYRDKFSAVIKILRPTLDLLVPDGGFYLWPKLPVNDEYFAKKLYAEQHVTVLPGSYLSRAADGINPGEDHIRLALVAQLEECVTAAVRIRNTLESI